MNISGTLVYLIVFLLNWCVLTLTSDRIVFLSSESGEENNVRRINKRFGQGEPNRINSMSPVRNNNRTIYPSKQIPIELLQKLSEVGDAEEFISKYVKNPEEYIAITSRFGEISERSAGRVPKPAGCTPELKAVPFEDADKDPTIIYFPSCTKVERCGGCCAHKLLECQPTEDGVEIIPTPVIVTKYTGVDDNLAYRGKEIIPLEKHTKCKCDCRIKEKDCTDFQVYSKNECTCKCKNADDELKCEQNPKKVWDPFLCVCRCTDGLECSTGSYFDTETCECVEDVLFTRRSVDHKLSRDEIEKIQQERKRYKIQLQPPPAHAIMRRKRDLRSDGC